MGGGSAGTTRWPTPQATSCPPPAGTRLFLRTALRCAAVEAVHRPPPRLGAGRRQRVCRSCEREHRLKHHTGAGRALLRGLAYGVRGSHYGGTATASGGLAPATRLVPPSEALSLTVARQGACGGPVPPPRTLRPGALGQPLDPDARNVCPHGICEDAKTSKVADLYTLWGAMLLCCHTQGVQEIWAPPCGPPPALAKPERQQQRRPTDARFPLVGSHTMCVA